MIASLSQTIDSFVSYGFSVICNAAPWLCVKISVELFKVYMVVATGMWSAISIAFSQDRKKSVITLRYLISRWWGIIIIITITITVNSWFSAPPTTRTMKHYTIQFNSAILELATVGSLEQERFQETLEDWRGTHQLEFCWQPVPCLGGW